MDQNERISAATLKLYAQRDTLNLYELACLAHDADPEQVALGVQAELSTRWREVHGTSRRPTMAESGELTNAMPEVYLGPAIGLTLKALCIATGGTFQRAVPIGQARRLLGALALDLPFELRRPENQAGTVDTKAPKSKMRKPRKGSKAWLFLQLMLEHPMLPAARLNAMLPHPMDDSVARSLARRWRLNLCQHGPGCFE